MAFDINNLTIVGRLTKDPELSYTPSNNTPLCKFSIANNTSKNNEDVNFFDVTVWNKPAEVCNQYLSKGSQIVINGRIQQNRYTNKEGEKRSKVEIVANTIQFVGGKGKDSEEKNENPLKNNPLSTPENKEDIPF